MDEQDFQLLLALDKTKNITHAADILYVTQSSLSKRVHALERELNLTLLIRSRQGIRFTPEGELVLAHVEKAADQLQLMRAALRTNQTGIHGTLQAGISINFALYRLPDLLAAYRQKYPQVTTSISTDHSRKLYRKLMEQEIDVAILRGEFPWSGHKKLLTEEKICVILPSEQGHANLTDLPFIGRTTDLNFERQLVRWLHENDIHLPPEGITVDNIGTCVEMVKRGLGWSIVPEICLAGFTGIIRPITFRDGTPFVRATYLMYTDAALALRQAEAFIRLTGEFAALPHPF